MELIKTLAIIMIASLSVNAQQKSISKLISENPKFDELIDVNAKVEILADGFTWAEGPVWDKKEKCLLFSDVPENTIYKYKAGEGLSVFLNPSGYTGKQPYSLEPGSNGLIINNDGELVACEHGDRRVTKMPMNGGGGKFPVSDNWEGKRFNSPNDLVQAANGTYYFTDPPYGLPNRENATTREIDVFGVYKVDVSGKTELVIKDLSRPNGVALSPDEKILYVAQSDPEKAYILAYEIKSDGTLGEGSILYDATPMVKAGYKGLPDGLKTDKNGNIFTTGPGGILVLTDKGELLGRIEIDEATANCAWGDDGSVLYITSDMYVGKIQTKTIGKGF
ncbi:SMP-30/gluconolactonase/LRE family protein [Arcticibacterium luteifluviistationis]|uniref:Gluconolactonase n=1 Tax=Arcticibacterium luteifluviistationis TaxID=1784714 RepID=A0A2Z4GF86_9BACT|nr:SMP-30/gluconolactonase/LRE family protein [Arcticibacterium luteifluviistationis]AWV99453.1 gluconolactonase [Arcticibacterium luteifluviistationis]